MSTRPTPTNTPCSTASIGSFQECEDYGRQLGPSPGPEWAALTEIEAVGSQIE